MKKPEVKQCTVMLRGPILNTRVPIRNIEIIDPLATNSLG
jgi:hypothetical protein